MQLLACSGQKHHPSPPLDAADHSRDVAPPPGPDAAAGDASLDIAADAVAAPDGGYRTCPDGGAASRHYVNEPLSDPATNNGGPVFLALRSGADPIVVFVSELGVPNTAVVGSARLATRADAGASAYGTLTLSQAKIAAGVQMQATHDGQPRVAYVGIDGDSYILHYIEWSGDLAQPPDDVAVSVEKLSPSRAALALDDNDRPVIAYFDANSRLRLASKTDAGWTFETVRSDLTAISEFPTVSVVVDSAGQPVVVAGDPDYTGVAGLWASVRTSGGDWSAIQLDPGESWQDVQTLRAPSGDVVVIYGYLDFISRAVRHEGVWHVERPLLGASGFGFGASAAGAVVDVGGALHLAYIAPDGPIGHAVYDGCDWFSEIVDPEPNGTSGAAIALDPRGAPHFAYGRLVEQGPADATPAQIRHAWPAP